MLLASHFLNPRQRQTGVSVVSVLLLLIYATAICLSFYSGKLKLDDGVQLFMAVASFVAVAAVCWLVELNRKLDQELVVARTAAVESRRNREQLAQARRDNERQSRRSKNRETSSAQGTASRAESVSAQASRAAPVERRDSSPDTYPHTSMMLMASPMQESSRSSSASDTSYGARDADCSSGYSGGSSSESSSSCGDSGGSGGD